MYMLQEVDILEDWTAIQKVGPAQHPRPGRGEGCLVLSPSREGHSLRAVVP